MKRIMSVVQMLLIFFVATTLFADANEQSAELTNIETISKAAKHGDAYAQFNLGKIYYNGKSIPQDYKQAASWYQKAARQGHPEAQNMLGRMYFAGKGLKKNYTRSAYWWSKSAKQGNSNGQSLLGASYSSGKGVPQDYKLTYVWTSLAIAQGDFTTKDIRDLTEENLSPQELVEAKELLSDIRYQTKHPDETSERIGSNERLAETESSKRGESFTQANKNGLTSKESPSLSGVYLRWHQSDVESLKLMKLVDSDAGKDKASKFELVNGNELSVTYRDSKVVFIELDWMENEEAVDTGVLGFKFNQTTLQDIREIAGNNGFAFESIFYSDRDVEFNSYEIIGYTDYIITFITKPTAPEEAIEDNISATAKLISIMLAEKNYLDELWGSKKIYDTNYKSINIESSNSAPAELSQRQIKIIQTVLNPDGYISKELHSEFWGLMPVEVRDNKKARNAIVYFMEKNFVFGIQFTREGFASMKVSLEAGRVVKTPGYESARNKLYTSVPPQARQKIQKSIDNAEGMIKAAAENKPFKSNRGTIYITQEMLNQVLAGFDASSSRASRLMSPEWGQKDTQPRVSSKGTKDFVVKKKEPLNVLLFCIKLCIALFCLYFISRVIIWIFKRISLTSKESLEGIDDIGFDKNNKKSSGNHTLPDNIRDLYLNQEVKEESPKASQSLRISNDEVLSDCLNKTTTPVRSGDPEFDRKNLILKNFLMTQELLLGEGKPHASFANEQEKTRYIHFVFGAIDLLSRTIKDENRSYLWGMATSQGRAAVLFGIDEALDQVESYGHTDDTSLEAASKSGRVAMHNFILGLNGKIPQEDLTKNSLSLFKIVRELN